MRNVEAPNEARGPQGMTDTRSTQHEAEEPGETGSRCATRRQRTLECSLRSAGRQAGRGRTRQMCPSQRRRCTNRRPPRHTPRPAAASIDDSHARTHIHTLACEGEGRCSDQCLVDSHLQRIGHDCAGAVRTSVRTSAQGTRCCRRERRWRRRCRRTRRRPRRHCRRHQRRRSARWEEPDTMQPE
jgi:hypothetical protein